MEIKIQSIHFTATEKLQEYIDKKVSKLEKANDIVRADVILKVVKPETAMNKEVGINVHVAGAELRAERIDKQQAKQNIKYVLEYSYNHRYA